MAGVRSYKAVVVEVVDGDTVKLAVRLRRTQARDADLGFHVYVEKGYVVLHDSFRLYGINAAEKKTVAGDEAKAWLKNKLPVGLEITVDTRRVKDRDEQEKYGRWLGTIFFPRVKASVNDQLVAAGHAKKWDGRGARPV